MRWLVLLSLICTMNVFAHDHEVVPVTWQLCSLEEREPAGRRLAKIYHEKIAALEIEKEMDCKITRWGEIGAWARCQKEGFRFVRVRMDVQFYCDSPKTKLIKTVLTYIK
jgi:hypothetical protein